MVVFLGGGRRVVVVMGRGLRVVVVGGSFRVVEDRGLAGTKPAERSFF